MISIGRSLRWYNKYEDEIDFSVKNHFDFMQIWFKDEKNVLSKQIINDAIRATC